MCNPSAKDFLKKIKDSSKYYISHHMLLSHNQHTIKENKKLSSYYECVPYDSSLPIPISEYQFPMSEDLNLKIVSEKEQWIKDVLALRIYHRELPKNSRIKEVKYSANGSTDVPYYLFKLAKHLKQDPDEYFESHFNWYMSGVGNLCVPSFTVTKLMFMSIGNELYVNNYDNSRISECTSGQESCYTCTNMNPIHETVHCQISHKELVSLRQRTKIHIVEYRDEEQPLFDCRTIHNSLIPLTSIIFDKFSDGVLYTDVDGGTYNFDLESKTCQNFDKSEDASNKNNWSALHLYNSEAIIKTGCKSFSVLDRRKQNTSLNVAAISYPDCDFITSSKLALNPYYLYLGSVHSLFKYDLRFLNQNKPQMKKWTHGLKLPPVFICNFNLDDTELVTLGSQLPDETCLIYDGISGNLHFDELDLFNLNNTSDIKENVGPEYIPKYLPNLKQSFRNSQRNGYCLNPIIDLEKRLSFSRTGMSYSQTNSGVKLLHMNAAGDVFSQIITNGDVGHHNTQQYQQMEEWSEMLQSSRYPFISSGQVNLKHFQNTLKRQRQMKIKHRKSKGFVCNSRRWKKSLHELNDYYDMWANELLSMWDVQDIKPDPSGLALPPVDTKFKINSWINKIPTEIDLDD